MNATKTTLISILFSLFLNHSANACDKPGNSLDSSEANQLATEMMSEFFLTFYARCQDVRLNNDTFSYNLTENDCNLGTREFNLTQLITTQTSYSPHFIKIWILLTNGQRSFLIFDDITSIEDWMNEKGCKPEDLAAYPHEFRSFPINQLLRNKAIFSDWMYLNRHPEGFPIALSNKVVDVDLHIIKNSKTHEIIMLGSHLVFI